MRHLEFPIASFLSLPLVLCSLPSHIRSGSVAIISLIAWLAVMSLIRGINSLIWADNFVVKFEVWCDITTKITIGFTYAVPASALCVLRHLESVASARTAFAFASDKRQRQIFEACMCFGLPVIFMALHYVVQGHRYDLIENLGCYPTQYFSVAALCILWIPALVMSLGSFVYAGFALRHFLRHRISFQTHLSNSRSSISASRYFRLMALAIVEMAWDTGITIYIMYFNIQAGFRPWISWANVHSNFSRVAIFPEWVYPVFMKQLMWQWWITPISCVFFFLFFSFGNEAMSDYRIAITWFQRNVLRQNGQPSSTFSTLPMHHPSAHRTIGVSLSPMPLRDNSKKGWDKLSPETPSLSLNTESSTSVSTHGKFCSSLSGDDEPSSPSSSTGSPFSEAHSFPPKYSHSTLAQPSMPMTSKNEDPKTISDCKPSLETHLTPPISSPHAAPCTSIQPPVSHPIIISEPYMPDASLSSFYHEGAFLTAARNSIAPPHPMGGILMTIERDIV